MSRVWLTTLSGSPGYSCRVGDAVAMRSFPTGQYDVTDDAETVAWVRRARSPQLILTSGEEPPPVEPLYLRDGTLDRLHLLDLDSVVHASADVIEAFSRRDPDRYPCPLCPDETFPSRGSLDLHMEMDHQPVDDAWRAAGGVPLVDRL